MKKISMAFMAAAMVLFVACGGKKDETCNGGTAEGDNNAAPKTETEAPAPAAASGSVDKYLSLVEEAIPLLEKVQKGDADAVEKYTKIAQELADMASSPDLQAEIAKSPEVAKKFQDAMQKFANASMK